MFDVKKMSSKCSAVSPTPVRRVVQSDQKSDIERSKWNSSTVEIPPGQLTFISLTHTAPGPGRHLMLGGLT